MSTSSTSRFHSYTEFFTSLIDIIPLSGGNDWSYIWGSPDFSGSKAYRQRNTRIFQLDVEFFMSVKAQNLLLTTTQRKAKYKGYSQKKKHASPRLLCFSSFFYHYHQIGCIEPKCIWQGYLDSSLLACGRTSASSSCLPHSHLEDPSPSPRLVPSWALISSHLMTKTYQ